MLNAILLGDCGAAFALIREVGAVACRPEKGCSQEKHVLSTHMHACAFSCMRATARVSTRWRLDELSGRCSWSKSINVAAVAALTMPRWHFREALAYEQWKSSSPRTHRWGAQAVARWHGTPSRMPACILCGSLETRSLHCAVHSDPRNQRLRLRLSLKQRRAPQRRLRNRLFGQMQQQNGKAL